MRFFTPCFIAGWLYPDAIFRIRTTEKLLCLTFDDGPDPGSTPRLLEILDKNDIKALFFCLGSAAEKYPGLMDQIKARGHLIGNHGYNHLSGLKTPLKKFVADVTNAAKYTSEGLFRPPYGRLRFAQYRNLVKTYKIIFWDLMPYDFDNSFSCENALRILKNRIRPGSIIVLHDTAHSVANTIIDEFLTFSLNSGYRFEFPEFSKKVK
jgi:peptidoglycan-N-acetylglucosamine deacetylase